MCCLPRADRIHGNKLLPNFKKKQLKQALEVFCDLHIFLQVDVGHNIENVHVSHKILNMYVGHKIYIHII